MAVQTISGRLVQDRMQSGEKLIFIDVRTPAEFDRVHAHGVESIPLDALKPADLLSRINGSEMPIYVICQSGGRAAKACEQLSAAGISKVFSVEGGTIAWQTAGLPIDRGPGTMISLERQVRIAAGSLVLLSVILGWTVHRGFLGLALFVGAGLVFAGATDYCGMGMLLAKMPWNTRPRPSKPTKP
jgi:rhodanese-related sulfurtransferase